MLTPKPPTRRSAKFNSNAIHSRRDSRANHAVGDGDIDIRVESERYSAYMRVSKVSYVGVFRPERRSGVDGTVCGRWLHQFPEKRRCRGFSTWTIAKRAGSSTQQNDTSAISRA